MAMSALARKAAFVSQVILGEKTMDSAANEVCGVTWYHLSEGIAGRRVLSDEVKQKFSAYIGRPVEEVFGDPANDAAA